MTNPKQPASTPDTRGLSTDEAAGVRRALEAGQASTLRFWDSLDLAGRRRLAAQLAGIDFALVRRLVAEHVTRTASAHAAASGRIEPAPVDRLPQTADEKRSEERFRAAGEAALRAGRVAALTVAGGQGTRLGYDGPKGCYVFGPVTGRTLFRHHAEKILAASRRYGKSIPWLVMTSDANDRATREYLAAEKYFGLPAGSVHIFQQGMLPASDRQGQLILEAPDRLAMSPNGHGGTIAALASAGMFEKLKSLGVDTLSYFQVDNPLVRAVDPVFIGRHIESGSEMSIKVLSKRDAAEKVGVAVTRGGKLEVIEYSDLPKELAEATDSRGQLLYWAGSIAIHVFSVEFLARLASEASTGGGLPYHRAEKSVPTVDAAGKPVKPADKNGIKFECFIFDALPLAKKGLVVETRREEEFAPIKNASGEDSPDSCRALLAGEWAGWLEAAGVRLPRRADGTPDCRIEVSPLYALDAAELKSKLPKGFKVQPGGDVVLA